MAEPTPEFIIKAMLDTRQKYHVLVNTLNHVSARKHYFDHKFTRPLAIRTTHGGTISQDLYQPKYSLEFGWEWEREMSQCSSDS